MANQAFRQTANMKKVTVMVSDGCHNMSKGFGVVERRDERYRTSSFLRRSL